MKPCAAMANRAVTECQTPRPSTTTTSHIPTLALLHTSGAEFDYVPGLGFICGSSQWPEPRSELGLSWTYLALATGQRDVDEAAGVCEPLLRAALGRLLLLLGLNLGCIIS